MPTTHASTLDALTDAAAGHCDEATEADSVAGVAARWVASPGTTQEATALIGVAAIGAYSFLGQSIRGATAGLALEIAGEDASGGIDEAKRASDEALRASQTKATLKEYNASNH